MSTTPAGAVQEVRNALLGMKLRAPVEGQEYVVGPGAYATIEEAVEAVYRDRGNKAFTAAAVVYVTIPVYAADVAISKKQGNLAPTAEFPLIVRGLQVE